MKTMKLIPWAALACMPAVLVAGGDVKSTAEAMFEKADTNRDAKLSPTEHATCAREMFVAMDANNDDRVTVAEMEAAHGEKMEPKTGKSEKAASAGMSAAEKIAVVDANGDGVLTAKEHAAATRDMFAKMDTNQDGFLTQTELVEGHERLMGKHRRDHT